MKAKVAAFVVLSLIAACNDEQSDPTPDVPSGVMKTDGGTIGALDAGPASEGRDGGTAPESRDAGTPEATRDGGVRPTSEVCPPPSSPASQADVECWSRPDLGPCNGKFAAAECREANAESLAAGTLDRDAWLWLNNWTEHTIDDASRAPNACALSPHGKLVLVCPYFE